MAHVKVSLGNIASPVMSPRVATGEFEEPNYLKIG
jgi:hypothetical protein